MHPQGTCASCEVCLLNLSASRMCPESSCEFSLCKLVLNANYGSFSLCTNFNACIQYREIVSIARACSHLMDVPATEVNIRYNGFSKWPSEMHHMRWAELADPPTISSNRISSATEPICQRMVWASLIITALFAHMLCIWCACSPRIMEDEELSYSCMSTTVKCMMWRLYYQSCPAVVT